MAKARLRTSSAFMRGSCRQTSKSCGTSETWTPPGLLVATDSLTRGLVFGPIVLRAPVLLHHSSRELARIGSAALVDAENLLRRFARAARPKSDPDGAAHRGLPGDSTGGA